MQGRHTLAESGIRGQTARLDADEADPISAFSRLFSPEFLAGARLGFRAFLPLSVGVVPWALVTGVAMIGAGLTPLEAMGMNILVFSGTAQLGTLPLIAGGAPWWLIVATALALNLRFVIFSAALAGRFHGVDPLRRWLAGYLLTDGVFAVTLEPMLRNDNRDWRLGCYFAPSVWAWVLWQACAFAGIVLSGAFPREWSLEFMATIALLVLLIVLVRTRPMLVAALAGAAVAVGFHALPLRLGLFLGIVAGIAAGFAAERNRPPPAMV